MLLVEYTAGAGAQIGGRFEELHVIREYARADDAICRSAFVSIRAICWRPATTSRPRTGLKKTVAEADRILGLEHVRVIHANDSKGAARVARRPA